MYLAILRQPVAGGDPGIQTVGHFPEGADFRFRSSGLEARSQQCGPLLGKFPVGMDGFPKDASRHKGDCGWLGGNRIAMIVFGIDRGFRQNISGKCRRQNQRLTGRRVTFEVNAAPTNPENRLNAVSIHEQGLPGLQISLWCSVKDFRKRILHDCDHIPAIVPVSSLVDNRKATRDYAMTTITRMAAGAISLFVLVSAMQALGQEHVLHGNPAGQTLQRPGTHAQPAAAQHDLHGASAGHSKGMTHDAGPAADVREGGQSAFAAIQEIVAKLMADPGTDWQKVNIEALRQHLVDMDNVTLRAHVELQKIDGGARFLVTSEVPSVTASIRAMVPAHVAAMNGVMGWQMSGEDITGGAALTIKGTDIARIRALGFIGVMSVGMHHQAHHLALASGSNLHDH